VKIVLPSAGAEIEDEDTHYTWIYCYQQNLTYTGLN